MRENDPKRRSVSRRDKNDSRDREFNIPPKSTSSSLSSSALVSFSATENPTLLENSWIPTTNRPSGARARLCSCEQQNLRRLKPRILLLRSGKTDSILRISSSICGFKRMKCLRQSQDAVLYGEEYLHYNCPKTHTWNDSQQFCSVFYLIRIYYVNISKIVVSLLYARNKDERLLNLISA